MMPTSEQPSLVADTSGTTYQHTSSAAGNLYIDPRVLSSDQPNGDIAGGNNAVSTTTGDADAPHGALRNGAYNRYVTMPSVPDPYAVGRFPRFEEFTVLTHINHSRCQRKTQHKPCRLPPIL